MDLAGTRITVVVRVRPLLDKELSQGHNNSRISVDEETNSIT